MPLQISSSAFQDGGMIPKKFTCDGADVSPALSWTNPPHGTQSFSLIADDPDAPAGTWVHWVLYDLPPTAQGLPEGIARSRDLSDGSRQGRNDFGKIGYNGPCPPRGATHRYFFKLFALDCKTGLPAGATKADLERTMKGHVLAQAVVIAKFQH